MGGHDKRTRKERKKGGRNCRMGKTPCKKSQIVITVWPGEKLGDLTKRKMRTKLPPKKVF